jgi:hypothetical protein
VALGKAGKIPRGPALKFTRKIQQVFKERSQNVAHLFRRPGIWHAFLFELREAADERKPGWADGTHLHFVSHLWPGVTAQQVLDYVIRDEKRPPTEHIRFVPRHADP